MLAKGARLDLHSENGQGPRPIHWASRNGHVAVVDILLSVRISFNRKKSRKSVRRFDELLKFITRVSIFLHLQAGVPVDATDHKGLTPLMMACMFGRSLMAAYLLGRGAQANLTDMNGDSALHWSAYKGFPSLMQMLIYSGFDPQKPDNFGSSPLHLACISGNLMAVKLLCAKVFL
jgi:ankyrin repeat protein